MKFHIYRDKKHEWRWRLKSRNGKIIADSGEGYKRKSACITATARVREAGSVAGLVVE